MNGQKTLRFFERSSAVMLLSILLCVSCVRKNDSNREPGIAISFDDHFIKDWFALRPMFLKYGARVTFYITCEDSLTSDEVGMLKQLRSDGHEIAFHGTVHGRATDLVESQGADQYIKTELSPGMGFMKAAGFSPTSYAHPGGNHNASVDSILFASGFKILRDVAISHRVFKGVPLYSIAPRVMNNIYYRFDKSRDVDALLIDYGSRVSAGDIDDAINTAKETNTALLVFGHQPLAAHPKSGAYGFDIKLLETLLKAAAAANLRFYTMSELPEL